MRNVICTGIVLAMASLSVLLVGAERKQLGSTVAARYSRTVPTFRRTYKSRAYQFPKRYHKFQTAPSPRQSSRLVTKRQSRPVRISP